MKKDFYAHGKVIYESRWFSILADETGTEFVQSGDEVLVVPLTRNGQVILTREPSAAFGKTTLILPGGETETAEPHHETANRELQEEIGYKAGKLDYLGELRPFSKYLAVRSYVYLAYDLTPSRLVGDEDYSIETERISLGDLERLISEGALLDARVIAALFMARGRILGSSE